MMLLHLLKRLNPCSITIAGFDGFDTTSDNYADSSFQEERHVSEFKTLNDEVGLMLAEFVETMAGKCEIRLITPSVYENVVNKVKVEI